MRAFAAVVLCAFGCACASGPYVARSPEAAMVRGVALGFVAPEDGHLERTLAEVHALGVNAVSILVPLYTEGLHGAHVRRGALDDARGGDGEIVVGSERELGPDDSARSDGQLGALVRRMRAAGLSVLVFPIVRLRARNPGEWRGKLEPVDRDGWWADYVAQIAAIAAVAQEAGASRLAIGSELVSFESDVERWQALATQVRTLFHGRLCYSANWDRYRDVRFWSAVDEVGVSAYFTLAPRGSDPTVTALVRAWSPIVDDLRAFAAEVARPILFTEIGFPSVHGAAFWPWNDHQLKSACASGEGCDGALDLEAQRRLWSAFVRVFGDRERTPFLRGLYAWLWAGAGGLRDRGYTPRGKPAETVLKLWYGGARPHP